MDRTSGYEHMAKKSRQSMVESLVRRAQAQIYAQRTTMNR